MLSSKFLSAQTLNTSWIKKLVYSNLIVSCSVQFITQQTMDSSHKPIVMIRILWISWSSVAFKSSQCAWFKPKSLVLWEWSIKTRKMIKSSQLLWTICLSATTTTLMSFQTICLLRFTDSSKTTKNFKIRKSQSNLLKTENTLLISSKNQLNFTNKPSLKVWPTSPCSNDWFDFNTFMCILMVICQI